MEKFYLGEELEKALRAASLLNRLTGKTVYINEDFGSDSEDDPWGFFVSTCHGKDVWCEIGGNEK